jgi:uncharacterized repeat protein (TIGR01451 family)
MTRPTTRIGVEPLEDRTTPALVPAGPATVLGGAGVSVVVGFFDADAIPDLAVATASNEIRLFRGIGDGTFSAAGTLTLPSTPAGIAVTDFDNDGRADDLAITLPGIKQVLVELGDGAFGFTPAATDNGTFPITLPQAATAVIPVDAGNDGETDLALLSPIGIQGIVGDLTNGAFLSAGVGLTTGSPVAFAVADVGGGTVGTPPDGDEDAVTVSTGPNEVVVNSGAGGPNAINTISGPLTQTVPLAAAPTGVAVVDFDGDGDPDVVVSTVSGVFLLVNNAGTLAAPVDLAPGVAAGPITAADVDADGDTDLVFLVPSTGKVQVLTNDGSGAFTPGQTADAGTQPAQLLVADLDGNTLPDVAVVGAAGLTVLLNRPTLSGTVFDDLNGNGAIAGEPGRGGVTVQLIKDANNNGINDDAVFETTTTAAGTGAYSFSGVGPGRYFIQQATPAGAVKTFGPSFYTVVVSTDDVTDQDFGNFSLIAISGRTADDLNGDGTISGDPDRSGVTVQLVKDTNNNGINDDAVFASTITPAGTGAYSFANLGPGRYFAQLASSAGVIRTAGPSFYTVVASSGTNVPNQDFGTFSLLDVSGTVFTDGDGDGVKGTGEAGVAALTVFLDGSNGGTVNGTLDAVETRVATDGNGLYTFTNLGPGTLRVRVVPPAGTLTTTGPVTVAAQSGQDVSGADVGFFAPFAASGTVFDDRDGDGARGAGEPGLSGVTVFLDGSDGGAVNGTLDPGETAATTSGSGEYVFTDLGPGTLRVRVAVPAAGAQTTANPAAVDGTSGVDVAGVDFGIAGTKADLAVAITDGLTEVSSGSPLTYTIALTNNGPGELPAATMLTVLPADLAGVVFTPSIGSYDPATGAWTGLNLAAGGSATLTAAGTLAAGATGSLTAVVTAFPGGPLSDPDPADNVATDTTAVRNRSDLFAVGSGPGLPATVEVFNADGTLRFTLHPFGDFAGGVTVATGDGTLDGVDDVVVGTGPGGGPVVAVFDGATGAEIARFFAYDPGLRDGVFVGAGDVTGDGRADVVTGPGPGGGPHVKVFDWGTFALADSFFAFDPAFRGGVTVRAGDVDGDGLADIVTGAGPGGAPHVKVFSGRDLSVLQSFFAGNPADTGGVFVGVADLNGDGRADLVLGVTGAVLVRTTGASASDNSITSQVTEGSVATLRVAAVRRADGIIAILIGAAPGTGSQVQELDPVSEPGVAAPKVLQSFIAFDPEFAGGVFVG